METKIWTSLEDIPAAAAVLRRGGLVAVPTETVYGLCANGLDGTAAERLYEVKGRPEGKPLSLMIAGAEDLDRYARDIHPAAYALAARFWPGPLTLVLPAREEIPPVIRAGGATVGLRCPDQPLTLALLKEAGIPLAGPSANPSGLPSPKTAGQVLGYFAGKIQGIIDGGPCGIGRESTVLDMSAPPFRVLRQGALGADAIGAALREGLTVVGITGGTGCGKTTALEVLAERGALVIDCDQVYHILLRGSQPMRQEIAARFGDVFAGGELDRKKLGAQVFTDKQALLDLNGIAHRYVREAVDRLLTDWAWQGGRLAAIDAIALLESGMDRYCTFTVGVTAPEEERVRRIVAREGVPESYARLRIAAQHPNEYFAGRCAYVLENNGTRDEFTAACRELFRGLLNHDS